MPAITAEQALSIAIAHHQAWRFAEAEAMCRSILAGQPQHAATLYRLGVILCDAGRHEDALPCFSQAVAHGPSEADYHTNLGVILAHFGRNEEAVASYRAALALQPGRYSIHFNLGNVLHRLGRFDEAIASYRQALIHKPDFADGHWNLALLLLLLERYEEGWREHEWRFQCPGYRKHCRGFSAPQWDGSPLDGRTILVHAEAGFGDTLQFLRYVPLVAERGGRVILECHPELARLVAQTDRWNATVLSRGSWNGSDLPHYDLQVPLLSLPLALGIMEPQNPGIPAGPWLHADPASRAGWRRRLDSGAKLRVGLAWAGNPLFLLDRSRSIAFDQLSPIFHVPNVSFVSVQPSPEGSPPQTPVIDMTAHITDFADTAALMAELDLIISVDTAAAHLAGALGCPVWTLLPHVADWRWGLEPEHTPWYPAMRLLRQPIAGDWDSVIQRVAGDLSILAGQRSAAAFTP